MQAASPELPGLSSIVIVHRDRIELPDADAAGRIQYAGLLPISSYAKGFYMLRVTVLSGFYMLRVTVLSGDKALSRTHPPFLVP